jgi:uncharacterized protein (UPF0332 family)
MSFTSRAENYGTRARESLTGAEIAFEGGRLNNCANRAYYAAFQAAIAALLREVIRSKTDSWPHTFVQSEFAGKLVNRRHLFPSHFRDVLADLQLLRHQADYSDVSVTRAEANQALRRSREFVQAILAREERS